MGIAKWHTHYLKSLRLDVYSSYVLSSFIQLDLSSAPFLLFMPFFTVNLFMTIHFDFLQKGAHWKKYIKVKSMQKSGTEPKSCSQSQNG